MKHSKRRNPETAGLSRPFEHLQDLLEEKSVQVAPFAVHIPRKKKNNTTRGQESVDDQSLFEAAMADVTPLSRDNCSNVHSAATAGPPPVERQENSDDDTLCRLNRLVNGGAGFVVSDTPEYMEGRGYNVSPEVTRRLHSGDFSIQAHIDLHGLNVCEAREAFERFIKNAVTTGKRAVLVVHGRGLSSPVRPVLKRNVRHWLTCGPWRKWVIAFASARGCDGGAGATYILLRRQPVTKRDRKKHVRNLTRRTCRQAG